MSGGHFNYDQYKLEQITDSIERVIEGNKKEVADEDRWHEVLDDRIYYFYLFCSLLKSSFKRSKNVCSPSSPLTNQSIL